MAGMPSTRGRRFTLLAAAGAIAVLVAAGIAAGSQLRERWYLSQLESENLGERLEAAKWLQKHGAPDSRERAARALKTLWDGQGSVYMRRIRTLTDTPLPK